MGHGIVDKLAREAVPSATDVEDVPCPRHGDVLMKHSNRSGCATNDSSGWTSDEIGVGSDGSSGDVGWIRIPTDQGPVTD